MLLLRLLAYFYLKPLILTIDDSGLGTASIYRTPPSIL